MSAGRTVNSQSTDWGTPPKYVEAVTNFLGQISLDPCSNEHSLVDAVTKIMPPQDGLTIDWDSYPTIYVNPPYGRGLNTTIKDWFKKASETESEVLMLVPVATNTSHWKKYVFPCSTGICFLNDTRLKFYQNGEEMKKGAPMACAMVYWGKHWWRFEEIFKNYGNCVRL